MKELEETNCEIRNVINLDVPSWSQLDNLAHYQESVATDGLKDSNLAQTYGGFLNRECRYAWLSHERRLIVIDARYGKCISTWSFPDKITSVCSFPMESGQVPLLLVGTDNNAIRIKDSVGYLYVYDCNTSIILTTIQVPAGVEKACIVHGGTEWEEYNEKRPDTVLPGNSGLIFAALRNLQHIVIDVNRLSWQTGLQDGKILSAKLEFVNTPPTTLNNKNNKELAYLAYNLMDIEIEQFMGFDRKDFESTPLYDENLCSILLSSTKTGCLITGCLGRVIIWQSDGSIGWISPPFDENAYVTHVALLEPSDDPRPFYYLWIACQNDSSDSSAVLRMYAMLFSKKHSGGDKSGESSLYFNLESEPSLKFELELEQGERVHSLISVERENPRDPADCCGSRRGEDSLLLIGSDERVLLFDLNRWYKEQMPRTMAECRNPNSVMASYRTTPDDSTAAGQQPRKGMVVACAYVPKSLREFPIKGPSSPEELFYPNSLTIEWLELGLDVLTHWLARGVQTELLREITIAGPIVLVKPTEIYHRCLVSGLVPFDSAPQDFALDANQAEQRQMLLSICLEQRWANFLLRCVLEWVDGSAAYLYPEFLRWSVQRASELKLISDQLCVPLFDQSGANIGEPEVRTLRFCAQQLECLGNVVSHVPNLEGDLERQRRALKRIATYLQVLLWFYDVGLLPESQDDDELEERELEEVNLPQIALPMKIPYPKDKLVELYEKKRDGGSSEEDKTEEILFIDQLMNHECIPLKAQWQREEAAGETLNRQGRYPPPSLQTLLRSFLTDCYRDDTAVDGPIAEEEDIGDLVETQSKHSVTIYLLMDLSMLLSSTHPSVDRLIKYPSAFKLSPSIIKLTQAFWLLDHEDYKGFFNIITGELISLTDIKDWHHKLAIRTLLQNNQHKLALMYLRIIKPPQTSLEEQGIVISLSVEQGLVESAFHARPSSHYNQLLTRFFQSCKANGKLREILLLSLDSEEEEAFVKFLKENNCEDIRLLYYLQRSRHAEAKDVFGIDPNNSRITNSRHLTASNKINPIALKMLGAYNDTLPAVTKNFASTLLSSQYNKASSYQMLQPQSFMGHPSHSMSNIAQGYPKPMSQCRLSDKQIYELAVHKTRETCLKAGRVNTSVNYVPFLGAPCSTIVFCTKATGSSNIAEQSDANCVLFPERKVTTTSGKRTCGMMSDGNDDSVDGTAERKRPRLASSAKTNLSKEENNAAQLSRRLSMSQVCETPLVQRKGKDPNSLAIETPHSILKIRQLLKRNSNSPGYNFNMGSNEKEDFLKPSAIGDAKPARQIRFSVERFSGNEDSLYSMNDSNQEKDEKEGDISYCSKNTDEAYYSPNASSKSSRDSSILTDSSVTKYFRGPRSRPSIQRSSLLSQASSDYLSHKTSNSSYNSTLNASELDISQEKNTNASTLLPSSSRKSLLSQTVYNASILSANTSVETSPFKRPFAFDTKRDDEQESEESEDQSEDEEQVSAETRDNEHSLATPITIVEERQQQQVDEKETAVASESESESDEQMETRDKDGKNERSVSAKQDPARYSEISDDEEIEEFEEQSKNPEDGESFASFSNSMDNLAALGPVVQCADQQPMENFNDDDLTETVETRNLPSQDYSLTENFLLNRNNEFSNQECDHSLTKPLFLDSRGMLKFAEPTPDLTDDESADDEAPKLPELESVIQSQNKVEDEENEDEDDEDDLKLNISWSDDNVAADNEQLASEAPTRTNGLSNQKEEAKLPDLSPTSKTLKRKRTASATKEPSTEPLLLSAPTTLIDDVDRASTPLRRSARRQAEVPQPSPRRSIKSLSPSPAKTRDSVHSISPSQMGERESRNTLDGGTRLSEQSDEDESKGSRSSSISRSSEKKSSSRTSSRHSSREPSHDRDASEEISITSKRSARATKQESANKTISIRTRARTGSTAKEVDKPTRKTKASTAIKDSPTISESSADGLEHLAKEPLEKKTRSRPRVASTSKDAAGNIDEETEEAPQVEKSCKSRAIRASSQAKDTGLRPLKRTRVGSVAQEKTTPEKPATARKTRAGSVAQDDDVFLEKSSATVTRKTRAGSVVQDDDVFLEKSSATVTRKTRAGSVAQDDHVFLEKSSATVTRKTRAGSVAQDDDVFLDKSSATVTRKTRAGSVVQEDEKPAVITRKTRAGSVAEELHAMSEEKSSSLDRKTRVGSIVKDEQVATGTRRTRAASVTKDTSASENVEAKRTTRAASVAKDTLTTEHDQKTSSKKSTRKRGGSVPKDAPAVAAEPSKLYLRSRRSTSLLQEVILEESLSQLDSPASKRSRLPRLSVEEIAVSSPAANTRSRRSSIQSVPEELEEILSVPAPVRGSSKKSSRTEVNESESRSRRAASVDSKVIVPAGKRVTRSILAKTAIIEQVIPEEAAAAATVAKSPVTKKQPTRRKRATSVPVDTVEETEKVKLSLGRPKRGRKVSEGKNFEFSVPEETGELPENIQGECRTPTYEFSKPAGFQKFISPIPDDEETSEMTTNLIKRINVESERATSVRMRRPRTCFVLPKKTKNKSD